MFRRAAPSATLTRVAIAIALGIAGCASVFGIDEPRLDPCGPAGCAGPVDPPVTDASSEVGEAAAPPPPDAGAGDAEAAADTGTDQESPEVVLCGGGSYAVSACAGATPVCCETLDGGFTEYACSATSGDCTGYPIFCSSNDDCAAASELDGGDAGPKVCCHFNQRMVCAPASHCTSDNFAVVVCDPEAGSCPAGLSCTPMPGKAYYGCK